MAKTNPYRVSVDTPGKLPQGPAALPRGSYWPGVTLLAIGIAVSSIAIPGSLFMTQGPGAICCIIGVAILIREQWRRSRR